MILDHQKRELKKKNWNSISNSFLKSFFHKKKKKSSFIFQTQMQTNIKDINQIYRIVIDYHLKKRINVSQIET